MNIDLTIAHQEIAANGLTLTYTGKPGKEDVPIQMKSKSETLPQADFIATILPGRPEVEELLESAVDLRAPRPTPVD